MTPRSESAPQLPHSWQSLSSTPLGHIAAGQVVGRGGTPTAALSGARTSVEHHWPQLAASLAFEPWLRSLRVERVIDPPSTPPTPSLAPPPADGAACGVRSQPPSEEERGGRVGFIGLPPDSSLSEAAVEQLATEALCLLARSVVTDLSMSRASGDIGELRAQSRRYWLEGTQLWNAVAPGICPALPDSETVSDRLQLRLLATRRLDGEVDEWQSPAVGAAPVQTAPRRSVAR